jgi:D-3-phosphoglycerate dehydrogenase
VFNSCKKGVRIVNVARGGIINEADLLQALKDGRCGGAALDVFEKEPPTDPVTLELIQHPKVVATPHLGASTSEAQVRVAVEVSEQFIALTGKSKQFTTTPGVVNPSVFKNLK